MYISTALGLAGLKKTTMDEDGVSISDIPSFEEDLRSIGKKILDVFRMCFKFKKDENMDRVDL